MQAKTILVIPCFNEAHRLNGPELERLVASRAGLELVMVDDGSTDDTPRLLGRLAASSSRIRVERLPRNAGKGEAVRRGLLRALECGATVVGYADADLSTPVEELLRMMGAMEREELAALIGARVRLLGHHVERNPLRHYLGRVFATAASMVLRLSVYDTQCGAKLFRRSASLRAALAEPFHSRWAFDVELLQRLLRAGTPAAEVHEFPLRTWRDVPGSKLSPAAMLRAAADLALLLARGPLHDLLSAPAAPRAVPGSASAPHLARSSGRPVAQEMRS